MELLYILVVVLGFLSLGCGLAHLYARGGRFADFVDAVNLEEHIR